MIESHVSRNIELQWEAEKEIIVVITGIEHRNPYTHVYMYLLLEAKRARSDIHLI